MDRAIVIGTYENLGFYFCSSLLEAGYEVTGIHYKDMDEELLEEKRMEIGRNANFQEVLQKEGNSFTEIQEQSLIIIDFNYLYLRNPNHSLEISTYLEKFLVHNEKKIKDTESKVICLLPIEGDESSNKQFYNMIQNVKASDYHYLYFSRDADIQKGSIKDLIEGGF
ncbi:hypothetical protein [Cytobacillus massiliigabonensis]|uniref:hypothetical protein n=1 Tax=Cytobacillus massiliigabonensis TaxID=1871011 RepID=UPI000C854288|nr:hypothetical protein [Cytobacillus massiliigabonensis]